MKKLQIVILMLAIVALLVGCSARTTGATNVTSTSATLNGQGSCDSGHTCSYWAQYGKQGTDPNTWIKTATRTGTGAINASVNVTGLSTSSHYAYEIGATQGNGNVVHYDSTGKANGTNYSTFTTASGTTSPSWRGDYSTGDFSQYDDCSASHMDGDYPGTRNDTSGTVQDYGIDTISGSLGPSTCGSTSGTHPFLVHNVTPPAGFNHAAVFQVRGGDASFEGSAGERTLDTLFPDSGNGSSGKTHAYQGASTWYRDEIYLPSNFQPTTNSDWNWMFEIHNAPDSAGDAMLSCGIDTTNTSTVGPYTDGGGGSGGTSERFSCRIFGGGSPSNPFDNYGSANWYKNPDVKWAYPIGLHNVPRGRWIDMVWHFNWDWRSSSNGGNGAMDWWVDGQQVASYRGPTLLYVASKGGANQGYLDNGYYRSRGASEPTVQVYHAAVMAGPTAASIGEALP